MNRISWLSLCLMLCVLSAQGVDNISDPRHMLVVPEITKAPVIDGEFGVDEWKDARRLDVSTLCEDAEKPEVAHKAELFLARDKNYLYAAAVCEADMGALASLQEKYLKRAVWDAPRLEMFFGNQDQFTQIITDYMGRIYKNFKEPFFCKVSHSDTGYTIEYAIPLNLLTKSKMSDLIISGNFYHVAASDPNNYVKATEVYSWFPAPGKNFQDTRYFGALLLETPKNIAETMIKEHGRNIDNLEKSGALAPADAKALKDELAEVSASFPSEIDNYTAFSSRLDGIKAFARKISEQQRKSFIAKFGEEPRKLLPEQAGSWREVPEKWAVKRILGKDYWYMYTASSHVIEEMEKAGLMELPLFKEGMFVFRCGQLSLADFLPPEGKYSKMLEKYPKAFTISTGCGPVMEKEELSFLKSAEAHLPQFLKLYASGSFAAFVGDETGDLQNNDFGKGVLRLGRPLPTNRQEAYEAFKYNYFYTNKSGKSAPFRTLATLDPEMRKHASSATGTYLHHIVASFGDLMGGQEMGETMDNTATYMAFARGAARQYDQPWRNYSVTYGKQYLLGSNMLQCATIDGGPYLSSTHKMLTPRCRVTEYCYLNGLHGGTTIPIQKYLLLHTYLCGDTIEHSEYDIYELTAVYDDEEKVKSVDPLAINLREQKLHLSPIGKMRSYFYENIVKKHDRGVSVTPVGLVFDRYHGYMPVYGGPKVWGMFIPNEAEKTMWALDQSVFPRKSDHEVFSNGPYGNIFDVLTNDADKKTLDTYRLLMPVGDVDFSGGFAERLMEYVENGGTLLLNTGNLTAGNSGLFPESFLGCKITQAVNRANSAFSRLDNSFIVEDVNYDYMVVEPSGAEILAVTADAARSPVVLSARRGKGRVILTTPLFLKESGSMSRMLKLFDHLMRAARAEALPLKVDTQMEYLINRNKNGWLVPLFNNHGIPPESGTFKTPPQVDATQVRKAVITLPAALGKVKEVRSWWDDRKLDFKASDKETTLEVDIPGGGAEVFEFIME